MCDTMVVLGSASAGGVTLFAKNSDRDPREAHELVRFPAAHHPPGATVRCTYIDVPQVEQTFEVLLCRPFWIWAAEMGANEHGVAIGNEAVFTRVPYEKSPALIGMDLLRLALERSRTAEEALSVITGLLAAHGQGGNCGYPGKLFYHNSFLIADPQDAWVLETAGRHWAAARVRDVGSISNCITIGERWDLASPDLVNYAVERRWCRGPEDFHFSRCYSDFLYTRFSDGRGRQCRTAALLEAKQGRLSAADLLGVLRDHGPGAGPAWTPARGLMGATVCDHAGFGPVRISQTTGSMVSHLAPDVQTHFVTGTAAPCTSVFKPVWLGARSFPPPGLRPPQPTAKPACSGGTRRCTGPPCGATPPGCRCTRPTATRWRASSWPGHWSVGISRAWTARSTAPPVSWPRTRRKPGGASGSPAPACQIPAPSHMRRPGVRATAPWGCPRSTARRIRRG